jgi:hypothetical protein
MGVVLPMDLPFEGAPLAACALSLAFLIGLSLLCLTQAVEALPDATGVTTLAPNAASPLRQCRAGQEGESPDATRD